MSDNLAKASDHSFDIGDLARTYVVVREIGRGGMARVYKARHRNNGAHVAIKVASPDRSDSPLVARLMREGRLMSRLQHPNIVRLYDVRPIDGGRVAMVMEYVHGMSLSEVLRTNGALSFATCAAILSDVGRALAHAHGNGIVHLDVKPANVLVETRSGTAKLSDFGIARLTGESPDVAESGAVIGTPAYMSPEQIDGLALDGRSDIYALGMLGWQLVSGEAPWAGEPLYRLLFKQKHESLRSLRDFRLDVLPRLELAIAGALEKDPAHRWQRIEDMLAQLEADVPTAANRERRALQLSSVSPVELVDQTTMPIYRRPREPAPVPAPVTEEPKPVEVAAQPSAPAVVAPADAPVSAPVVVAPPRGSWRRREFAAGIAVGALAAALVALQISPAAVGMPDEPRTSTVAAAGLVALPPVEVTKAPPAPLPVVAAPEVRDATPVAPPKALAPAKAATTPVRRAPAPRSSRPAPAATRSAPPARNTRAVARTGSLAERARSRLLAGDAAGAAVLVDSALKLNPRDGDAYLVRARLRHARGAAREARTDIELAAQTGRQWEALAMSAVVAARSAGSSAARSRIDGAVRSALNPRRRLNPERAVGLASALVAVGDHATALTVLERSEKNARLHALLADPLLNPLRSNPRFKRLQRGAS